MTAIRMLLFGCLLAILSGCAPFFSSGKAQIETLVDVGLAGTYTVTIAKDGTPLYTETWVCTPNDNTLPSCKKIDP